MLVYLLLDMIFSSKLTVFFHTFQKLHFSSRRFRFSEQLILADKYPRIFSYEMEAIVYLFHERALDLRWKVANEAPSAELAVIISYPTSESGIIVSN